MDNRENNKVEVRERRGGAAAWALLGVLVGFSLPVLACTGFFFIFIVSLSAGGAPPELNVPQHVSGPLTGPAVAIIEVSGPIFSGSVSGFESAPIAAADSLISLIRAANANPEVEAILLKVDSPGGSVVASDLIYQELFLTEKPIVVLIGEIGASGAYYISMPADHIIANPNSLVGSIGVISTFPNIEGLMEDLGVQVNVITSGESKDFGSLYRGMTEEEIAYWQSVIDGTYENFVAIVAEGRGMTEAEVRALADGRVFTGEQALALGLVDELGYERDAIQEAADLGGIFGDVRVVRYTSAPGFFQLLGGAANANNQAAVELLERMLAPKLEFRWWP
jgi:protease-4